MALAQRCGAKVRRNCERLNECQGETPKSQPCFINYAIRMTFPPRYAGAPEIRARAAASAQIAGALRAGAARFVNAAPGFLNDYGCYMRRVLSASPSRGAAASSSARLNNRFRDSMALRRQ